MLLNYFLLATSVSIDSLGIGITYGFRNTKLTLAANLILFFFSFLITSFSIWIGNSLVQLFPNFITSLLGSLFLLGMGLWVIYQSLCPKKVISDQEVSKEPKIYKFFIDFLGITIQIIRDPISSDQDCSQKIDWKESVYLGFALSIDSIGIGICSSMIGPSSLFFPLFVASFQLFFLRIGNFLGKKLSSVSFIPENIWSVLSGVLLITIGISKFFL